MDFNFYLRLRLVYFEYCVGFPNGSLEAKSRLVPLHVNELANIHVFYQALNQLRKKPRKALRTRFHPRSKIFGFISS